ncbi:hypothetical protein NMY22_g18481 [Coprinellus aureogranulatus]|nr:hypothetical protein NMY22_g18481 [Coprinellus aureogranulatus]
MSKAKVDVSFLQLRASALAQRQEALRQRLDEIFRQRAKCALGRNSDQAIAKLPQDVLSRVFVLVHSLQTLDTTSFPISRSKASKAQGDDHRRAQTTIWRAEVAISHVCHLWRDASLRLPNLWNVYWCDKPPSSTALIAEIKRLKTYLSRSAPEDLELYFDFTMPIHHPESALTRESFRILLSDLLDLIVPHARRWRNLTIVANDSSRRISLTRFQRAIACVSAPRLERLVVCVGLPYYLTYLRLMCTGWENRIFLLKEMNDESPCPRLQYLKLDHGGLRHCNPPSNSLVHLVLESGPSSVPTDDGSARIRTCKIDWPSLLSSELLRLPQLQSLSLHEDVLNSFTFPTFKATPEDEDKSDRTTDYSMELSTLKHLRIGSSFRESYSTGFVRINRLTFFNFFLRFISAPLLESLTVCGSFMDSSSWDPLWMSQAATQPWFDALTSITLSDIYIGSKDSQKSPFSYFAQRTCTATSLRICQQWPNPDPANMVPVLDVVREKLRWTRGLWPQATDIAITMPVSSQGSLEDYILLSKQVIKRGNISVLRIPPIWFDAWSARVQMHDSPCEEILGGDNYVWWKWLDEGVPHGSDGNSAGGTPLGELKDRKGSRGSPVDAELPHKGPQAKGHRLLRIEPMKEDTVKFWPPDGGVSASNTLSSEQFAPFREDISLSTL